MRVPLTIIPKNGNRLEIYQNNQKVTKNSPWIHRFYSKDPCPGYRSSIVSIKAIGNLEQTKAYVTFAKSIKEFYELKSTLEDYSISFGNIGYLEQIFIDRPDWVLQFPCSNRLSSLYIDIEVATYGDGFFPKSSKNPILCIGAAFNNEDVEYFYSDSEAEILTQFFEYVQSKDPDLIITYNGKQFDIPYLISRAILLNIDPQLYLMSRNSTSNKALEGRVHVDLYENADQDQSLFGIKSKSLKDVSRWFGFNPIELPKTLSGHTLLIPQEDLKKYQISDVEATRIVAKAYVPNSIALAEMLQVPLSSVVGAFPSFIPKLIIARECHKKNIFAIDNNLLRYGSDVTLGKLFNLGTTKYEGAIVDCKQFGYIQNINKVDFTSMYPSSIRTWNLGPDTTKIVDLKPLQSETNAYYEDKILVLELPDSNIQKTVVIHVDTSQEGLLKKNIELLTEERNRIKAKLKENYSDDLHSRQIAIKVILNSIYGYLGSPYSSYGDIASGIAVTALCRDTSKFVSQILNDRIVNIDTDGFIVTGDTNVEVINAQIATTIFNKYKRTSYMILEEEPLIDGYFYKMKNYIVRKLKKNKVVIEKHGVRFKSSRQCVLLDEILEDLITKIFDFGFNKLTKDEQFAWAQKTLNLEQYSLEKFKYRLRFSKELKLYNKGLSLNKQLGLQVEEFMGITPNEGLQIEYLVTKTVPDCIQLKEEFKLTKKSGGPYYKLYDQVKSIGDVDFNYYKDQIEKIFDVFEIEYKQQRSLF